MTTETKKRVRRATGEVPGKLNVAKLKPQAIPGYFTDAMLVGDPVGREFNKRLQFLSTMGLRTVCDMLHVSMSGDKRVTRGRALKAWASADSKLKSKVAQKALELSF